MLIQVDAHAPGLGGAQQLFLTVVPEGEASPGPVQAPGERVVTQTAQVIGAFTVHFLVRHPDGNLCRSKGGGMLVKLATQRPGCGCATGVTAATNLCTVKHPFPYLVASPLHLPVVRAATQRLSAEHLPPEVKTFRMFRMVQSLGLQQGFTASLRQLQVAKGRVWIHGGFKPN